MEKSELIGQTLIYEYDNGESYKLEFEESTLVWTCLAGVAKGHSGIEKYDFVEVASEIIFISWLEQSREVVSIVFNLNTMKVFCSYVYEINKHQWKGKIISFKRSKG
ncbi:phenolic acid decarboxylase [Sediminitomix flava]|uniref:Molybdenum cofactor biosynthesis protein F n=1 Tax=Sediminitomix flava TaxID=379075 RepID=A0A315ZAU4_SEDFL|nr:phenolic acid decarboxylase [Sediminitomix flava]PWJ42422.1 molybdenum cofactor biosynthesis protein F [Sediminitomix flava]